MSKMPEQTSFAGQVMALHEAGYSAREVWLELKAQPNNGKLSLARVRDVLARNTGRGADSRRLFEVHELLLEVVSLLREMRTERQRVEAAKRMRGVEQKLEKITESSSTRTSA